MREWVTRESLVTSEEEQNLFMSEKHHRGHHCVMIDRWLQFEDIELWPVSFDEEGFIWEYCLTISLNSNNLGQASGGGGSSQASGPFSQASGVDVMGKLSCVQHAQHGIKMTHIWPKKPPKQRRWIYGLAPESPDFVQKLTCNLWTPLWPIFGSSSHRISIKLSSSLASHRLHRYK